MVIVRAPGPNIPQLHRRAPRLLLGDGNLGRDFYPLVLASGDARRRPLGGGDGAVAHRRRRVKGPGPRGSKGAHAAGLGSVGAGARRGADAKEPLGAAHEPRNEGAVAGHAGAHDAGDELDLRPVEDLGLVPGQGVAAVDVAADGDAADGADYRGAVGGFVVFFLLSC